jgi:hypothetical protein
MAMMHFIIAPRIDFIALDAPERAVELYSCGCSSDYMEFGYTACAKE